jgi:hypothetical protein
MSGVIDMLLALKSTPIRDPHLLDRLDLEGGPFGHIRCPQCRWQPEAGSRWCCACEHTPEPWFDACGTTWNTFLTHGTCPGCSHQWHWTSCLHCGQWSLHDDWYEDDSSDG